MSMGQLKSDFPRIVYGPRYFDTYVEARTFATGLAEAYPDGRYRIYASADYRYPHGFVVKVRDVLACHVAVIASPDPLDH